MTREQLSNLGPLVRRLRESAGLQQKSVAERTNMQLSKISRIENGRVQPEQEEVAAILRAIGSEESLLLAEELEQPPLKEITAPTWHELKREDREALREADATLEKLTEFTSRKSFSTNLAQYTNDLRERLHTSVRLLINNEHSLVFIGPIGVGKTTAINALFDLMGEPKQLAKKGKPKFKAMRGLLPTGTGRTTAFEYRVTHGAEVEIHIVPQSEEEILRDVRNLCHYWHERIMEKSTPQRVMSEEAEKVYRNMAGLAEGDDGEDPLVELLRPGSTREDLFFEFRRRLDLTSRIKTDLVYRKDREAKQTESQWITKRCKQLNFGLIKECPLPRRLTLVLPNPKLEGDGAHFTVVDTRGIDESALRRDVTDPADDPRAISILCSRFFDAPTERVQQLIEHLRNKGSDALPGRRVMLLVLHYHDEALKVPLPSGEHPDTREQGYRFRERQVRRALGAESDAIELLFFDAEHDDADVLRAKLLDQIETVRSLERAKIHSLAESVDALLDNQEKVQFEETQRKVREKIKNFISSHGSIAGMLKATHTRRLVKNLMTSNASALWSVTRNDGYGRSINIYYIFGLFVREDSKIRTDPSVIGFMALMTELLQNPEMNRRDMQRSKRFVVEILENISLKQTEFLKQTEAIGETTLEPLLQHDQKLWIAALAERGTGPGYRDRVVRHIEDWFDDHPEVSQKLDERIQDVWDGVFINWLKGYIS